MRRTKLGGCLVAAAITLAGATHLARVAEGAPALESCTETQAAYAQGFADGSCTGGGTVSTCEQTGGGGFYFIYECGHPH